MLLYGRVYKYLITFPLWGLLGTSAGYHESIVGWKVSMVRVKSLGIPDKAVTT